MHHNRRNFVSAYSANVRKLLHRKTRRDHRKYEPRDFDGSENLQVSLNNSGYRLSVPMDMQQIEFIFSV
jgi:hypothetical protein